MVVERRKVGGVEMEELLTGVVDGDGRIMQVIEDGENEGVVRREQLFEHIGVGMWIGMRGVRDDVTDAFDGELLPWMGHTKIDRGVKSLVFKRHGGLSVDQAKWMEDPENELMKVGGLVGFELVELKIRAEMFNAFFANGEDRTGRL